MCGFNFVAIVWGKTIYRFDGQVFIYFWHVVYDKTVTSGLQNWLASIVNIGKILINSALYFLIYSPILIKKILKLIRLLLLLFCSLQNETPHSPENHIYYSRSTKWVETDTWLQPRHRQFCSQISDSTTTEAEMAAVLVWSVKSCSD